MTRRPSTLILAGALAAGCSKPNPLFLDTVGSGSDSGGASTTGANTVTEAPGTTVEPTSSGTTAALTTSWPGTTGTSHGTTSTSESSSTSGVGPTSDATTDEPFVCEPDLEGCCEVRVEAVADSFFTDAVDGANPNGCPLAGDKPPLCSKWSFGRATELTLFSDYTNKDWPTGISVLALRFPMEGESIVVDGEVVPQDLVKKIVLELSLSKPIDWQKYDKFEFDLYGLPEGDMWTEGDGMGVVPCANGNSSYACRACGANPNADCLTAWSDQDPIVTWLGKVTANLGGQPMLLELPFQTNQDVENHYHYEWLVAGQVGLVVVPTGVVIDGIGEDRVPGEVLKVHARESGMAPALRLTVCKN
ncbi:MAG TPA: hypothetical protein VIK91_04965 [Nannocystis sp.]